MCDVSNTAGSISHGETSWETGDTSSFAERKEQRQALIKNADSVSLSSIFRLYNLKIDEQNTKVKCPFKHHSSGRERTPSFVYYPATNSFWCFGCHTGRAATDFVANIEGITKYKAAIRILDSFNDEVEGIVSSQDDFSERLELLLKFSSIVRNFKLNHFTKESFEFIENICKIYDSLLYKKGINNQSIKHIIEKLEPVIIGYK